MTVEQYRRLAATLHHAQSDDGIKVVMVASALAGEGKTLTAVNLALTLSESYGAPRPAHRRRSAAADDASGVSSAERVRPERRAEGGRRPQADRSRDFAELSLLPAGRPDPDPMSGLTSDRMRRVIEEAAAKFDWVMLDTPPSAS